MATLAILAAALSLIGVGNVLAGWFAARRFAHSLAAPPLAPLLPPVSVLKPLYGEEPLLEEALASFCAQDYPAMQIVFGVHGAADPAVAVVARLQRRFPDRDLTLVIDPARHGSNGKVGNLINMLPAARHDILVIADADMHAPADHLRRVVTTLCNPGTGLATTLYTARPANRSLAARLGASHITHGFLPGALLARALGRHDCFGATMALRRETLASIGGFPALVDHLADDAVLGQLIAARGLAVALAPSLPATTVPETTLRALLRHELRWARTVRSLAPLGFAASAVQYPLAWAALAVTASAGAAWALLLAAATWAARAAAARGIDRSLGLAPSVPLWLLAPRDLLSIGLIVASFLGDTVHWRGQLMAVDRPAPLRAGIPVGKEAA